MATGTEELGEEEERDDAKDDAKDEVGEVAGLKCRGERWVLNWSSLDCSTSLTKVSN